ncbi:NUDIX domain-containing protein [Streptomyces hydrogenans]|uniref:NUDIX domain-containing protein n=1 Tax=Streptomyces hydrogenans TaxID=1873719 RepID=UPI0035D5F461
MPPSPDHVRALITEYLERHPDEGGALAGLLTALDAEDDPTSRSTLPGHVTCGGVVLDADGRVLHIAHRASGLLLPPGGHVEATDDSLFAAVLREIREETGIPASSLVLTPEYGRTPIDVDVHAVPENAAKGEGPHRHYDFRFVFRLAPDAPELALQEDEVAGAVWLPRDEVRAPRLRARLRDAGLDSTITPVDASVVIHDGRGRYLLQLRDADKPIWAPGHWDLLGGGREPQDATLLDTAVRELREEAGLELAHLRPYAVEHVTGTDGTSVPRQVYTGEWDGDPDTLPLTEGQLLAWRDLAQLPYLTMLPSTRGLLERHAAAHAFPAHPTGPPAAGGPRPRQAPVTIGAAPPDTEPHIVGVHLVLERDGQVLLGRRHPDSAFAGGMWHVLAGHCAHESATACLVREAKEEAGLLIDADDLHLVHLAHTVDRPGDLPRMQLFFRARAWEGTPRVLEPDKTVAWRYWDADRLPDELVPYTRAALEGLRAGRPYTETGWAR